MMLVEAHWQHVKEDYLLHFSLPCLDLLVQFLLCKHLVQQFHPVEPQFFLEVTQNQCSPFWSHPSLKPLSSAEDIMKADQPAATEGAGDGDGDGYNQVNTAGYRIEDLNGGVGCMDKATFEKKMEDYIHTIRDFCNGLEYQVKFQDTQFLGTLEKDGAGFIRLVQNCLSCERQHNSSRALSPTTWERSTANVMFY
ncbi:hypothetical protein V8E53_013214 [Lactarius tabidus]